MDTSVLQPSKANFKHSITDSGQKILDFWHKVEFFIPYDLEKQILDHEDKDWAVRRITAKHLASFHPKSCGDLWNVSRVPSGKQLFGFELYFGIFDKELLSRVVRNALRNQPSELEESEDFERGDYEGLTCFAKMVTNAFGEPKWDSLSVSTVPWALGRLKSFGLQGLDFEDFESSFKELQLQIADFKAQRINEQAGGLKKNDDFSLTPMPLVRADIEQLERIFCAWADVTPDHSEFPVIVIRAQAKKESKKLDRTEANSSKSVTPSRESSGVSNIDDEDQDDDEQIEILNSFYAKDIQRVLRALDSQKGLSAPLAAYLAPVPISKRISVYSDDGRKRIRKRLCPANLPGGRWLGEPQHNMSLMQQFAINEAAEVMEVGGVFSVNGPPGTGKTTLLRDMFAEIVTQRARVLASFPCAQDAFESGPSIFVGFENRNPTYISRLKQELTGFEIVVASSNNAAVENISRDLPKASALGNQAINLSEELAWRKKNGKPKFGYLQPVAAQYASRNRKGEFEKLSVDDGPWGLIACVLGNQKNRRHFSDAVFGNVTKDGVSFPKGYDPLVHKSIWQWRDSYRGPTFLEAVELFRKAEADVLERRELLAKYVDALEEIVDVDFDSYTVVDRQLLGEAEAAWISAKESLQLVTEELAAVTSQLEKVDRHRARNDKPKISALKWLFSGKARRDHHEAKIGFEERNQRYAAMETAALLKKIEVEPKLLPARSAIGPANSVREKATNRLKRRVARWNKLKNTLATLGPQFTEIENQWATCQDIEDIETQKAGLWPDPELNIRRSKLFAAALTLHEAWLADVSKQSGGFGGNLFAISSLLGGGRLLDPGHAKAIWQSLFMMVPVVSSTFASIGNQFRELGPGSLGWLFIDEAGQAVPQAAVGALWRCKKAMVVGDPLQIEPVFTVPARLIEELERNSGITSEKVAPHKRSVQNLADEANVCGAYMADSSTESGNTWIGSPLRVHRRCADPMFSVANKIAYEGKMIFGAKNKQPPSNSLDLGGSAWVQIPGVTVDTQVVPEQIQLVVEGLVALAQSIGSLPQIYVISPFRRIASTLRSRLNKLSHWPGVLGEAGTPLTKSAIRKWCKSHIGTVHTFQGRQASIVWMVLGCDESLDGAVTWASRKPNILNVAVTRAEHRFFMIGDFDVWGSREHFRYLRFLEVPQISPSDFMARIKSLRMGNL